MLPPRDPHDVVWMRHEIARLQYALDTVEHRNAELIHEASQLRRLLFEERTCNNVVNGIERVFADALEDAKDAAIAEQPLA